MSQQLFFINVKNVDMNGKNDKYISIFKYFELITK